MKKILLFIGLFFVGFLSACTTEVDIPFIEEVDEVFEVTYDGLQRKYYVYVPSGVKENAPMLFMLHGYGGTINQFVESTDLKEMAERDKVILVYPEGTPAIGLNHWNAFLRYEEVDDIGFITFLRNSLVEEYQADEDMVFIGGHSNGGFMAYTLACETNDLFKAYMSISGLMSGETWETCDVDNETNIFQFHGTSDQIVPIDGSMTDLFGWGGAPRVEEMLEVWIDNLENPTVITESINTNLSKTTTISSSDYKVVYIEAEDYGHMWADDGDLFDEENDFSDISELLWGYMMSFIED